MNLTDKGCPLISIFLKNYPGYFEVDFKSNKLTSNGFLKLCEAFRNKKDLQILSLNNNYLGQDTRGLEGLYTLLVSQNLNIKEVNLRNNEINDEGAKIIASIIKDS